MYKEEKKQLDSDFSTPDPKSFAKAEKKYCKNQRRWIISKNSIL